MKTIKKRGHTYTEVWGKVLLFFIWEFLEFYICSSTEERYLDKDYHHYNSWKTVSFSLGKEVSLNALVALPTKQIKIIGLKKLTFISAP